MSVKYITLSTLSSSRGPKSSQQLPWFRRRAALVGTTLPTVTVSVGAVAHTKGAWTQVTASTAGLVGAIRLRVGASYGITTGNGYLMDVGIGAAGSEVVIAANIAMGGVSNQPNAGLIIDLPIAIPSGSRVALRAQSNRTASSTFSVQVVFAAPSDPQTTPSSVDSLGVSTATSSGTAMSGASGTYVQIIASTTKDYQALIIVPSLTVGSASGATVLYTVAIGAAGSERDIYQMQAIYDGGLGLGNIYTGGGILSGGGLIPAGSRISIKHNIAANPANFAASVIGVPYV
jgi:hypothetical protein